MNTEQGDDNLEVQKQNKENNKTNSTYKTKIFSETFRGKIYNWTVSSNELSDEAIRELCELILKIF